MTSEQGETGPPERSLLSRRHYLAATGAAVSGGLTVATGSAAAASGPSVSVTAPSVSHRWTRNRLDETYDDAVVIAPSLSFGGSNPATPRVRSVGADRFDLSVEEWEYLDGYHLHETVGCFTTDVGVYAPSDGPKFEVGRTESNHRWSSVSFEAAFDEPPLVFANVQTVTGPQAVTTRVRNVGTSRMEVRLQEEEAEGPHLTESLGYLAVEPGTGTIDGHACEADAVDGVTHEWQAISFADEFSEPVFLAALQSYQGSNTATIRYRNLSDSGVEVKVEEEQSDDAEMRHLGERVGYLVAERAAVQSDGYGLGGYGADGYGN